MKLQEITGSLFDAVFIAVDDFDSVSANETWITILKALTMVETSLSSPGSTTT